MLSFTSFHCRGALNITGFSAFQVDQHRTLKRRSRQWNACFRTRVKAEWQNITPACRPTMRNICSRCWGNLFIPCHTLDLKGEAYGHHDYPKTDHRACH